MQIKFAKKIPARAKGIVLFLYAGALKQQLASVAIPKNLKRQIAKCEKQMDMAPLSVFTLPIVDGGKEIVIVVHLGKKETCRQSLFERAIRAGVRLAAKHKQQHLALLLPDWADDELRAVYLAAFNAHIADFSYLPYKKTKSKPIISCDLVNVESKIPEKQFAHQIALASVVAEEVNRARTLSNAPGGDMTPRVLATHAKEAGRRTGFTVSAYGEKKMKDLGMGGILGVSRGSAEEAQFIICEYKPKSASNKKPIIFIGKGVTFDTGGLNIKPDMNMTDMHMDMSGASSVLHAIAAIARLQLPIYVVGLIPAVENMPSGSGYRPGDILRSYSGKTIEVKHTDAEGRIILADALGYAKQYNPELIIDLATLTGAALVALGQRTAAILSPDEELQSELVRLGQETGDRVWPLPLWEDYKPEVAGQFADVANLGKTKFGGTITGAVFLWEFAPTDKWAHIDIAPTMVAIDDDQLAPGSKGAGVHLLTMFARVYAEKKAHGK